MRVPIRHCVLVVVPILLTAAVASVSAQASGAALQAVGNDLPTATGIATDADAPGRYDARIRRTTAGVAHIEAADLPSLGFGEGYAQAEDHICTIADQVIRARGQRAKYFGRGEGDAHVQSDIAMRTLRIHDGAAELLQQEPQEIRDWLSGYAAGYNRYLADTGPQNLPPWCRDQDWVVPISASDIAALARFTMMISTYLGSFIAAAAPPAPAAGADGTGDPAAGESLEDALAAFASTRSTASNGWAIGRDRSESGGGMLLVNPHFPWAGLNRFWEKHLRIPGELDVYGASALGGPGVLLGFTEGAGWTHTSSPGTRYTLYSVDLVPGNPTRYRFGDSERDMRSMDLVIDVLGETEPVRHTSWFTHHGPVVASPRLRWTTERAYALRDANADNLAIYRHVLATNRAASLDDVRRAHAEHHALPWIFTIAVSADGVAWYADASKSPHLSEEAVNAWIGGMASNPLAHALWQNETVLLDGSSPLFDWVNDPAARHAGTVPFSRVPQIERTDYVFNANDSFWLPNASVRIEGDYSPLQGQQKTPRSPRTRSNALYLENAAPYSAAGEDGRFSLRELQGAVLANRSLAAELLAPELVERCRATPSVTVDSVEVDLSEGCAVLAAWDHRFDVDSRGAVLFREWLGRYPVGEVTRRGNLFAEDFDPDQPLTTPRGLAPGSLALENLARAVTLLRSRGIALDTPLGELQYAPSKMPRRIPVHGGELAEGVINMMLGSASAIHTIVEPLNLERRVPGSAYLTEGGYPVLHGTSFLMALEFTDRGPQAMALLTYGQSGDPRSEHFTDQTEMFARKEWRRVLFREADIAPNVRREYRVSSEQR